MTYKGRIKRGVVISDENVALPEGAEVEVLVSEPAPSHADEGSALTPAERMKPFTGKATGLPADAARNVDYDLYFGGNQNKIPGLCRHQAQPLTK